MMRKHAVVIFLILTAGWCSVAGAHTWTNAAADNQWTTNGNWDLNSQPTLSDNVLVDLNGTNSCILNGSGSANWIQLGAGAITAEGHLRVTGSSTLELNNNFKIGDFADNPNMNLVEVRDNTVIETSLSGSGFLQIANQPGSKGRLELHENATFLASKRSNIGQKGEGHLAIYDNASFITSGAFYLANASATTGRLEMYGGLFEMQGYVLYVASPAGSTAHIQADGGLISVKDLVMGDGGTIDITKGTITVNQNGTNYAAFKTAIQGHHAAGRITGYDDPAKVIFQWDDDNYTLTMTAIRSFSVAIPQAPADGGEDTDGWMLAWLEGLAGGFTHDVYFGTDYDAVMNADKTMPVCDGAGDLDGDLDGDCTVNLDDVKILCGWWLDMYDLADFVPTANNWQTARVFKGHQSATQYSYGDLKEGQTYYWRIDEVDAGNNVTKGDVQSFTAVEKWRQDEFIISIGWTDMFGCSDRAGYIQRLVDLGINNVAEVIQTFDECANAGLKVMLKNKPSYTYAPTYKDNPALWGYWQEDEPSPGSEFEQVGQDHLLAHWADIRHPSYTNLQSINYGIDRDDVYDFIDIVNPEVLSFDFYVWYWGVSYPWKSLIENLEFYREVALANDIPLHSWVEVDADGNAENAGTAENRARYRYSVYMNLTYGVKGIFWFTASKIFNKTTGTISKQGYYDDVQVINNELANLGPELINLTSTAVYHTGIGTVAYDHAASMHGIPGGHWIQIDQNGIALGMFTDPDGDDYAMVMNRNKDNASTATLRFPVTAVSHVKAFDALNGTWSNLSISGAYPNQSVNIVLDGGTGSPDGGMGKLIQIIR